MYAHDKDVSIFMKRLSISVRRRKREREILLLRNNQELTRSQRRRRRRRLILGPFVLLKTMLYDPLLVLDRKTLSATYSINIEENHDFFIVTGGQTRPSLLAGLPYAHSLCHVRTGLVYMP